MPFEFPFDWFQSSGVLQLEMPTPFSPTTGNGISISGSEISNTKPMCDVRVNGFTYTEDTFNLLDIQQSTANIHNQTLTVTPAHTTYNAGDGLSMYFNTISNVAKTPNVRVGSTLYGPTQVTEISYDSSFSGSLSGTQLTLTANSGNSVSAQGDFAVAGNPNVTTNSTIGGSLVCDSLTVTQGIPRSSIFDHYKNATQHAEYLGTQWQTGGVESHTFFLSGSSDSTFTRVHYLMYQRLAGIVYLDLSPSLNNGYFDVYLIDPGTNFIGRYQNNAPGSITCQSLCVISGEQHPNCTKIKIIPRKGAFSLNGVGYRDGYGESQPQGMMHGGCVFTSGSTSLSDQRLKTDVSAFDNGLLLDFCNSLVPIMYSRIHSELQPRLGLVAQDVEAALVTQSLPQTPFINKLYQSIENDGDIQDLLGLDYPRLSVCLLGAVKELTNRITQLDSQLQ